MSFVDELNSGKYDKEKTTVATEQMKEECVGRFREIIQNETISARNNGLHTIQGYFVYGYPDSGYGNAGLTLQLLNEKRRQYYIGTENLIRNIFSFEELKVRLENCLKELGFSNYKVEIIERHIWKKESGIFREWKWVKSKHSEKTIEIECYW